MHRLHTHKLHNHLELDSIHLGLHVYLYFKFIFCYYTEHEQKLNNTPFNGFQIISIWINTLCVYDCKHRLSCFHGVKGHISNLCPIRKM